MSGRVTARALMSVVIIGVAMVALRATTMRDSAAYFKHVDEVVPQAAAWYGKNLQLHGFVEQGSILRRSNTLDYRFTVRNGDSIVVANYSGVVPDTFKDGAEVVLKGRLAPGGFQVDPNGVVAKCPSKYEAAPVSGH